MPLVEELLQEIDALWGQPVVQRIPLHIIGSAALMLQADYQRGTKDSDVLETRALEEPVKKRLLELAGKDTALHLRRRLYVDIVGGGLPFLPQSPLWQPLGELNRTLSHFEAHALDIVDVVLSKLKRFSPSDRDDIAAMIDRGRVPHDRFITRFREAVDWYSFDARASELPRYLRNLHQVERDLIGVDESEIELPDLG